MNSVQQQCEHHHQKGVLIESFHLSGHTFRQSWIILSNFVKFLQHHLATTKKEQILRNTSFYYKKNANNVHICSKSHPTDAEMKAYGQLFME